MSRRIRFTGLIGMLCGGIAAMAADPGHVPGRLLLGRREALEANLLDRTLRMHRAVVRRHIPQLGLHVVDVPEDASDAILASLRQTGLFDYVERDFYAHTASTPNDPSYQAQWHLPRIGSADAWSLTIGSPSVVVAVVDSGVYAQHPDLSAKLVAGWNFVKGNADTADVLGHGTAVAGTLAAATNNGIGVAGVSWATLVMPLVAVDEFDYSAYSDMAAAIQYAADHRIRIINLSLGGASPSTTLQNAVDYAWNRGALVFAAAMNSSASTPFYPAACNHAVAVSATDANDHLASFSNFGNWITLAAPGTDILTTMNGGGYGFWNGTSFSSPIAAGVAALVLAVKPDLTNQELLSVLKHSADGVGSDTYFGAGRVNAARAVQLVSPPPVFRTRAPLPPSFPLHRSEP